MDIASASQRPPIKHGLTSYAWTVAIVCDFMVGSQSRRLPWLSEKSSASPTTGSCAVSCRSFS